MVASGLLSILSSSTVTTRQQRHRINIITIMEKTEAGLRLKGLCVCIREIDVKSKILVHKILQ